MAGGQPHPWSGFTLSVCQLRPESRGCVQIASADPLQPPSIQANYLATVGDRQAALVAVREARAMAATRAMRPYVRRERKPGPEANDDAALLAFCRQAGATIFHPVGTCRMGTDEAAVVDARLRVHGIEALRVVDASVMPTLVSGNTHAPVVAIAERAADLIRADARR
jgi:choline dehydrogenase